MLKLGSHVGMSGDDMMEGSAKEAVSYGANTFMLYTGAPQNTRRKDVSMLKIDEAWEYMSAHGIDEIIVHAPYIINLANTIKPETYEIAENFLETELERTAAMRSKILVLHPGAHVGAGTDAGIAQIVHGLDNVLGAVPDVMIALETMAGKGSEIGRTFEEIARIYDGVTHSERLKVCFDTCHVSDSGYPLAEDLSGVLSDFDKVLGLEQIAVFHINDSKNPCGSMKDRHENIGFGQIGFDTLNEIVHMKEFENVPKILETPYVKSEKIAKASYPPYKFEIEMLKNGVFDEKCISKILAENEGDLSLAH